MIFAIVLAAGRSRRMGVQKLLLPWAGQPMIAHIVDEVLRSPVDNVHVVIGADGPLIAQALANRPVTLVTNPSPESEMLDSIRCGLRVLPPECEAVLVVLGDQPGVTTKLIATLVQEFHSSHCGIVVPVCRGRRGHPLLLAARYRDEVLGSHDTLGLRGLLQAHTDDLREVEIDAPEVLEDIDEPADYQKLTARGDRPG